MEWDCVSTAVHKISLSWEWLTSRTYWPLDHANLCMFFCTLEPALMSSDILSHKSCCMTYSFNKSHKTAVVGYLGTAISLFSSMCCKDCCHMPRSASKFIILFVLAETFAHSWQKLKTMFRNSLVRADSPFSSYNSCQGVGRKRRQEKQVC